MTKWQAKQVRQWRMHDDLTWRAIATRWIDAWGETELLDEFLPGDLSGNQLVGMSLCERASAALEEPVD